MRRNKPEDVYRSLLKALEVASQEKLSTCEKTVFMQYCLSHNDFQPVTVVLGKLEAEAVFKSVISKLKKHEVLPKHTAIFLSVPLKLHGLEPRIFNSLKRARCKSMADTIKLTKKDFLSVPGFGERTYNELADYLAKAGYGNFF